MNFTDHITRKETKQAVEQNNRVTGDFTMTLMWRHCDEYVTETKFGVDYPGPMYNDFELPDKHKA